MSQGGTMKSLFGCRLLYSLLAGYPASLGPLLPCLPPSPFLPPCPLPPVRPSLSPSSEGGGVKKNVSIFWAVHDISRTFYFCGHPKPPHGTPWGGVGQICFS